MTSMEARGPTRTLLLYCPYDKRVTRHGRRGKDLKLTCLDCGRGVENAPLEPAAATAGSGPATKPPSPPDADIAAILAEIERGSDEPEIRRERRRNLSVVGPPHEAVGHEAAPHEAVLHQEEGTYARRVVVKRQGRERAARRSFDPSRAVVLAIRGWHLARSIPLPRLLVALGAFLAVLAGASLLSNLNGARPAAPAIAIGESSPNVLPGRVANTEGIGVFVRRSPELGDRLEHAIPEGSPVRVLGAEMWVNGIPWRQVEDGQGVQGWVPSQYVRVEGAAAPG